MIAINIEKRNSLEKEADRVTHYSNVINYLTSQVQEITKMYTSQKNIRLRQNDKSKSAYHSLLPVSRLNRNNNITNYRNNDTDNKNNKRETTCDINKNKDKNGEGYNNDDAYNNHDGYNNNENIMNEIEEERMSKREKQILEEENRILIGELENTMQQTRKVEESVMEISNMMNTFVSHITQQSEIIEHNHQMAVNARANIDQGARELRRAAQWSVDFRVFVLIFLLICSFSLLFLHHVT